ncbi:MAG: MATE family efflux transporter [Firmicutes bacterium]|nr:MATE family efflux transporter [Bacillota bacterium]
MNRTKNSNDFSKGSVMRNILSQAVPLTIAQLVHLLYNVVDRIYLGHMSGTGSLALTGVGLTFPIVTLIMAFAALFGNGGVPLFSIERGAGNSEKAGRIMGNSFTLIVVSGLILTAFGYAFRRPVLFAFGASEESFVYARAYLNIYLAGTVFSMIATGMNGYINAQGFPRIGMLSVVIGAVVNIALDPVLIFGLHMGVAGAALATVISQIISALWILRFLSGKDAVIRLERSIIGIQKDIAAEISKLGTANFVMQGTTCIVQVACNRTLQTFGGDIFVGIMTVTNSVREIFMLPISGISSGSMPVLSFNYGAKRYDRVREGIRFNMLIGGGYTLVAWLLVFLFPKLWFSIFSDDAALMNEGSDMLRIYFFGFVFMSFQFAGQVTFQSLGDAKHAIFFSLLRKVIIVLPLTLLLPRLGFGAKGVFIAEPVSNVVGGLSCYITMMLTAYSSLKKNE